MSKLLTFLIRLNEAIQEKKIQERVQRIKLHQAAIKTMIKKKKKRLIPEEATNKNSNSEELQRLENSTQTDINSIKSKNTQKLIQQILAKEIIKTRQLITGNEQALLSHGLMAKIETESNHQMLKELKHQKRKQAELKKLSIKQLLTRLRRLV